MNFLKTIHSGQSAAHESGFGLLEFIISIAVLGLIILLASPQTAIMMAFKKEVEIRTQNNEISSYLNLVDCESTQKLNGLDDQTIQNECVSTSVDQKPRWLDLYKQTPNGPELLFKDSVDSNGIVKVGRYKVRVSCSAKEGTFVVQAVRVKRATKAEEKGLRGLAKARNVEFDTPEAIVAGIYQGKDFQIKRPLCLSKSDSNRTAEVAQYTQTVDQITRSCSSKSGRSGTQCDNSKGWVLLACYADSNSKFAYKNNCCVAQKGESKVTCYKAR
ncbi:MAG: hypothetical protein V4655_13500 [Bdellovibrionota bacterium]